MAVLSRLLALLCAACFYSAIYHSAGEVPDALSLGLMLLGTLLALTAILLPTPAKVRA